MTTDYRALCAELLAAADEYAGMNPYMRLDNAMKAARAALAAEPVPPDAGEVAELVRRLRDLMTVPLLQERVRAANLLERLAEPEPAEPSVEKLAQLIYERAMAPAAVHCKMEVQPWTSRGNSTAQDDARDCARAVLARWGQP